MKRWQMIGVGLLGLMMWGAVQAGPVWSGRGQGFRPCPYAPYVCKIKGLCKPFDERGKIAEVLTESLESGMYPGMAMILDIKKRGQVYVHLGPVWYLERQEFVFVPGEEVQVKGLCGAEKKDGMLQVVAYEIIRGDHVLSLRDSEGRPNWEAWRKR